MKSKLNATLVLSAALILVGCGRRTPVAPADRTLTILAIDYSGSTEAIRKQLLVACHDLATNLDEGRCSFKFLRFGHRVEEVYSGVPADEEEFAAVLAGAAKTSDAVRGTSYSLLAQRLASIAAAAPERRVRIIVAGDGEDDYAGDPALAAAYRKAAASLKANPKVELVRFWGVRTGAREPIQATFVEPCPKLDLREMSQPIDG